MKVNTMKIPMYPMRKLALIAAGLMLAMGSGCQRYYVINDPQSWQLYYTDKWVAADGYRGPLTITADDGRKLRIREARVSQISHEDYIDGRLRAAPKE